MRLSLFIRSSLITVGTSHGFALSFAFLSAASHRWRVHSSATMVSATLNLPCVGQSKPVASPVRGSSCAGDLQIGQRKAIGYTLISPAYGYRPRHRLISVFLVYSFYLITMYPSVKSANKNYYDYYPEHSNYET